MSAALRRALLLTLATLALPATAQATPGISLTKTGPGAAIAGSAITFAITVTNTGDEGFPAAGVDVRDPQCSAPPVLQTKLDNFDPQSLDPGDVWIYTCTVGTQVGATFLQNEAGVCATPLSGGSPVSATGTASVVLIGQEVLRFAGRARLRAAETLSCGGGGTAVPADGTLTSGDAAITTPVATSISIVTASADPGPTSGGYEYVGSQFTIEAGTGGVETTAPPDDPFRLVFTVDASLIPDPGGIDALEAFRNDAVIAPCATAGIANPDPCVESRTIDGNGDGRITVLSTHASKWNLGISVLGPSGFGGFGPPVRSGLNAVRAGSDVPLKFRLAGTLAPGYPTLTPIDCSTHAAIGPSLQATGRLLRTGRSAFIYQWKSPRSLTGCAELNFKTTDGQSHKVLFRAR